VSRRKVWPLSGMLCCGFDSRRVVSSFIRAVQTWVTRSGARPATAGLVG